VIHLKTCGGLWEEGMAIYDAISLCPCVVTMLSYTHARSMSSIILQAADYRLLMPNSYMMLHNGDYAISGQWTAAYSRADFDKVTEQTMYDIYADRMAMTPKTQFYHHREGAMLHLRSQIPKRVDYFLRPADAIKLGLADAIYTSEADL